MYCAKCGNKMNGNESFCPACGEVVPKPAEQEQQETNQEQQPREDYYFSRPAGAKSLKKPIMIISIILAAALLIGGGLMIFLGSRPGASSPEKAFKNVYGSIIKNDPDKVINNSVLYRDCYLSLYGDDSDGYDEKIATFKIQMSKLSFIREDYKFSIVETEKFDTLEEVKEAYGSSFGSRIDLSNVDEFAIVTATFENDSMKDDDEVICLKMDGRWFVYLGI